MNLENEIGLLRFELNVNGSQWLLLKLSRAMTKMCLMSYANNKGADQPAHPRSLISTFVVRCLDSIMLLDFTSEISIL